MRCPKCGYISFDQVDECLKCNKNIKSASEVLQGSVSNSKAPSFLKFGVEQSEPDESHADLADEISSFNSDDDDDGSEFLLGDDDFVIEDTDEITIMSDGFEDDGESSDSIDIDEGEIEGEIEVDLSQFEEFSDSEATLLSDDAKDSADTDEEMLEISVPDELNDMSDLDPPALLAETDDSSDFDFDLDTGSVDLDLDDLDFDLALDDIDIGKEAATEPVQETVLALDDIDFSEILSEEAGAKDNTPVSMDMDEDLDFDLDLGGLSIPKDL